LGIEVAEVTDMETPVRWSFPFSTDGKWENGKPGESLKKPKIVRRNPAKPNSTYFVRRRQFSRRTPAIFGANRSADPDSDRSTLLQRSL
jgi:hypothetical protein